jgi:signal transduction histidine kinase
VGECLCGLAALKNEPIYSIDIFCDPRCTWEECKKAGLRSFAALPLYSRGQAIGVLGVASGTERDFEEQSDFLETLAGQVAIALQNALLYKQVERHAEKLEERVAERTEELRDTQEQLVRREKLATLGQLAGSVAHELRNPLAVLSNAAYFLKRTLADADEIITEYLDIIASEVHKSDKIVSDLLNFSRTRLAERAEREETMVSGLVARVLAEQPPPKQIEVSNQIDRGLPPVFVDPQQMGQVLTNLIINACQAMPTGGRLTLSANVSENRVSLLVSDTGYGIPPENMENLFEPLFTTKAKGIGLGLAVSKRLVEANGGSIGVESEEGKGSTFIVKLPTSEKTTQLR